MIFKVRILQIRVLLKIYKSTNNILPKSAFKLKRYIEKISLQNGKYIYNKVKSNEFNN
ncbi:hypothetical protein [Clostridium sp.]|uniref:hypothetical protein n=1 Tax=Clostridium sp. TaxID=1506 RepID=UPI001EC83DE8|nr:hypothetical protein [Clostridium sp.]MBS5885146.1 hypothetical protein [Clostridium sp.]